MSQYRISTLVFLRNSQDEFLLIERRKAPNKGRWSPIGGKLDMESGESPFECAVRETKEEVNLTVQITDLHLFGYVAEKNYQDSGHWLMFLFDCKKPTETLPPTISEGRFGFFSREAIETLPIPDSDRILLWPNFDKYHKGFAALRADCRNGPPENLVLEQMINPQL